MEPLFQYVQDRLWPHRLPTHTLARRALVAARYVYALVRDLATGELSLRAMSLVYTTMLAVVPVLAFSFSVAKGLGYHRDLEPILQSFLQPIGERAGEVSANIVAFVDNVSGVGLASVAIGVLLLTTLQMAQKVEGSFNFVWRVDRPRSFGRRLSDYLSVMLIGPVVMLIAMSLIATLSSTALVTRLREAGPALAWIAGLSDLLPFVLLIAGFSFLYHFIPNARVRIVPAIAGGLFAGAAWGAGGQIFTQTVVATGRYQAIYAGFAVVFIIMIWVYLSWLILLLGAQLAFYIQNPHYLRLGQRTETMANALRERLALSVMLLIGRDFEKPGHGWRIESLGAELRVPYHFLEPIMEALHHAGLVTQTSEQRLIPARSLRRITVTDILGTVRLPLERNARRDPLDWNPTVDSLARSIDAAIDDVISGQTLADLVDRDVQSEACRASGAEAGAGTARLAAARSATDRLP
jgi:membrane protein